MNKSLANDALTDNLRKAQNFLARFKSGPVPHRIAGEAVIGAETFENYDPTGAWRIKDNEVPVDSAGELYDGTHIEGPDGLRAALLKHQDVFLLSFTENLMTYALGRRLAPSDMPTVRAVVREARKQNRTVSAFVTAVANSPAFRMAAPDAPAPKNANDVDRAAR